MLAKGGCFVFARDVALGVSTERLCLRFVNVQLCNLF
jgi:hypothetical protein